MAQHVVELWRHLSASFAASGGLYEAALERFTLEDWLHKHTAVSDEEFVKDPTRNRLAIVLSRTNHASYHLGQSALAKWAQY